MTIYLVMGRSYSYNEGSCWPVCFMRTREDAELYRDTCNRYARQHQLKYDDWERKFFNAEGEFEEKNPCPPDGDALSKWIDDRYDHACQAAGSDSPPEYRCHLDRSASVYNGEVEYYVVQLEEGSF